MASEASDTTVTTITNNGSNINNNNNNSTTNNNNTSNASSSNTITTNKKSNNSNSSILSLDSSTRKFSIPISTKIDSSTFGIIKRCIQYSTIISQKNNYHNHHHNDEPKTEATNSTSNSNSNSNSNNDHKPKISNPTEEKYEQHIQKLKLQLLQNEHDQNVKQCQTLKKKYLELQQNILDLKKTRKSLKKRKHQILSNISDDGTVTVVGSAVDNGKIKMDNDDSTEITTSASINDDKNNGKSNKEIEYELKIQKLQNEKNEMNKKLKNIQLLINRNQDWYEQKKKDLMAKHERQKRERSIMKKRKLNDISGNNNSVRGEDDDEKLKNNSVSSVGVAMEDDDNYEEGEVIEDNDLPLKKKMKVDEKKDEKVMKEEEGEVLVDSNKMESEMKVRLKDNKYIYYCCAQLDMSHSLIISVHRIIMCTHVESLFQEKQKEMDKLNQTKSQMAWLLKKVIIAEQKQKLLMMKKKKKSS
jgi:hypothetical protein